MPTVEQLLDQSLNCTCPQVSPNCVPYSLAQMVLSHFESHTCLAYLFNHSWLLTLDSCFQSNPIEFGMVQVYRLLGIAAATDKESAIKTLVDTHVAWLYGVSERAFVYSNESRFEWWPPTGPALSRFALIKLNTNLTKTNLQGANATTQTPAYLSVNCSLTHKNHFDEPIINDRPTSSSDQWRFYVSNGSFNLSWSECAFFDFYYECDNHSLASTSDLIPLGTGLLYIQHHQNYSGEQSYLSGLYVGMHPQTGKLVFLSLHKPFLNWMLLRMGRQVPHLSTNTTTIFWGVFIVIFNVLPSLLLCLPPYS